LLPELCFPKLRLRMAAQGQTLPAPLRSRSEYTRANGPPTPRLTRFTVSSLWSASSAKIATFSTRLAESGWCLG